MVIVVTGDGAIEEGTFYESLVFLKSNELCSLVIIENNDWSLATRINERRCSIDFQQITGSLGLKYQKLAENDTYKYIEKLKALRQQIIKDKTPVVVEVAITTLGGYDLKEEDGSASRFINYHAGSAPEINLLDGPLIEESNRDPVFVLQKYFNKNVLKRTSSEISGGLEKEINETR